MSHRISIPTARVEGARPAASSAAEILRAALAELRRPLNDDGNGWAQGRFVGFDRCMCAVGAINIASDRIWRRNGGCPPLGDMAARVALCKSLGPAYANLPLGPSATIVRWNDRPGRRFADVATAFERAIELAEAGAR
ncbi:Uncharacterised protein [Mycobacteroides abscessus subsp. abscessus]|nr:Uncharacterised protein [Mycobacteroides abscessus subsp. abscessus]SKU58395.1 Uncharacterised protein [Mycobacteroides abscessus subsp. abscessus]